MLGALLASCTPARPAEPVQLATPASPDSNGASTEFSLADGTTWVYSYVTYEPTTTDSTQIMTATYLFTETVVDTKALPLYFVAHVQHEEQLVTADPNWTDASSRPHEFWYVVQGQQVYESFQPLDLTHIQTDTLLMAYDLPLSIGKSWCPSLVVKGERAQDCPTGQRTVVNRESYETPVGRFQECYQITEDVNSGGVTQWFCRGTGVVAQKYDHGGTRFGFQQTLIFYASHSP